jgi:pimeloyl-ACP methyl ester carboxylesterase
MWTPLAAELMRDHRVVAVDLRGMGLSAGPADGYTKKVQADDMIGALDALGIRQAEVVAHDIGNMVVGDGPPRPRLPRCEALRLSRDSAAASARPARR